jgi:hypothetical protein
MLNQNRDFNQFFHISLWQKTTQEQPERKEKTKNPAHGAQGTQRIILFFGISICRKSDFPHLLS